MGEKSTGVRSLNMFKSEICCCYFSIHNYHTSDHKYLMNCTLLVTFILVCASNNSTSQIGTVISLCIGYDCKIYEKMPDKSYYE